MALITVLRWWEDYARVADAFSPDRGDPVPVWLPSRSDLLVATKSASDLYDGVAPRPADEADLGIIVGDTSMISLPLVTPFARHWIHLASLDRIEIPDDVQALLVVGLYRDLTSTGVRALTSAAFRRPDLTVGFLSGRDAESLSWFIAKQWLQPINSGLPIGWFSTQSQPPESSAIDGFGPKQLANTNLNQVLLGSPWRRLTLQGHGKDDVINLDDYTICGLNPYVPTTPGRQRPRCGYGFGCFKDESKLIRIDTVRAVEVLLSSCHSGPVSDVSIYDEKYMLSLSALDGTAQTVSCAMNVHSAREAQDQLWLDALRRGLPVPTMDLNASLGTQLAVPAFWHFGLPPRRLERRSGEDIQPARFAAELRSAGHRLRAMLSSELLPDNHAVKPALRKINRLFDDYTRRVYQRSPLGDRERDLRCAIDSVDARMANMLAKDPEDALMNFGVYFSERADIDMGSVEHLTCACGQPAVRYTRSTDQIPGILPVVYVVCLRCGDVEVAMEGMPRLMCRTPTQVVPGNTMSITVEINGGERCGGTVGVFVPPYMREWAAVAPPTRRVKLHPDRRSEIAFEVDIDGQVPPQSYWVSAYCLSNLGLSTTIRHFGVAPAAA
jgi:hypothetical protein